MLYFCFSASSWGQSSPSTLTSLQMLLCRSGSTSFFPVRGFQIPRDFLHVVLISVFISARYLWNRQIDFTEKAGGLFRRGQHPLVLNLDECCYYCRFHFIKNEKDLAKHFFLIVSLPVLKWLRGFLIL